MSESTYTAEKTTSHFRDLPFEVLSDPSQHTDCEIKLAKMCMARDAATRSLLDLPDGKRSVIVISISPGVHEARFMITAPGFSDDELIERASEFSAGFVRSYDLLVEDRRAQLKREAEAAVQACPYCSTDVPVVDGVVCTCAGCGATLEIDDDGGGRWWTARKKHPLDPPA